MESADELKELTAKWLDGTLRPDEVARLLELCRESGEALQSVVESTVTDRLLPTALEDPQGETAAREVIVRLADVERQMKEGVWKVIGNVGGHLRREKIRRLTAIAAVVVLAFGGGGWWWSQRLPVGVISRVEAVDWEIGMDHIVGKREIRRGDQLKAGSGLLELRFSNGAKMLLEGPFDLSVGGRDEVRVNEGRIVTTCPPSAKGFRVVTQQGTVTDLGTEFGVHVGKEGKTEVHVLSGLVELAEKSKRRYSLFEGEALTLSEGTTEIGNANSGAFITKIPDGGIKDGGFVHWSFDEGEGDRAADSGRYLALGRDSTMMLMSAGPNPYGFGDGKKPAWIEGVKGKALAFDGVGAFAESGFRGIEGALPRTVAMWVKLPEGDVTQGQGILSWGSATSYGVWQISVEWKKDASDKMKGRLRLGTYTGLISGTTQLCDGKWHHVAVVLGDGSKPGDAANVLFYVDGKLEPVRERNLFRVDTNVRQAESGVILGRHSVPVPGLRNFYGGCMDEVFIFDRALGQKEILHLMKNHSAP